MLPYTTQTCYMSYHFNIHLFTTHYIIPYHHIIPLPFQIYHTIISLYTTQHHVAHHHIIPCFIPSCCITHITSDLVTLYHITLQSTSSQYNNCTWPHITTWFTTYYSLYNYTLHIPYHDCWDKLAGKWPQGLGHVRRLSLTLHQPKTQRTIKQYAIFRFPSFMLP